MTTGSMAGRRPSDRPAPAAAHGGGFGDDPLWRWATFAPSLLLMLALSVLPIVNLAAMSFFDVRWAEGAAVWRPVGLANYRALTGDPLVRAGLSNTALFVVVAVAAQMVLGFALALFCSRIGRGQILYRTIFLLPILIPGIVIGAIWKLLFNYDFGLINQALALFGIGPHDWLGSSGTALLSVIIVDIWHWTPFCFLLMLAAIESLPQEVYEASKVDGASGWQELWWITLPMLWPAILVTLAFRAMTAVKVFDEVYLLTGGGPGTATEVVSFTIYRRFYTEDRLGYGSALATAAVFAVALVVTLALTVRRREGTGR
ncbi:MAG TPA: sugar ABC transporter permease [Geminicoccaceae bacterium]|nr:sugar ABC transporter permease [Geminicoccaceae bacterium]